VRRRKSAGGVLELMTYGKEVVRMNVHLPEDPVMLLSVINTKLRDYGMDLAGLCEDMQLSQDELCAKLERIDYKYDKERNQFV